MIDACLGMGDNLSAQEELEKIVDPWSKTLSRKAVNIIVNEGLQKDKEQINTLVIKYANRVDSKDFFYKNLKHVYPKVRPGRARHGPKVGAAKDPLPKPSVSISEPSPKPALQNNE